ncbi:MAG TPA: metal/formaldehyde-sensitive transcriptional repressor [Acidobacteriaceae bacterium]
MPQTERDRAKLRNRIRRIHGQIESVERTLSGEEHDCPQVLMLLAAVRGGINGLMAEVLEDHIRLHLPSPEKTVGHPHELAEDLIDLVRAYLK